MGRLRSLRCIAALQLLFFCVMCSRGAAGEATSEAAKAAVSEALRSSCMSAALQQFYSVPSRRPHTPNTSCDSQERIREDASSGVFRVRGFAQADHLMNKKLRIGVPVKVGFNEFVKVDGITKEPSGFSIDVFRKVMEMLPYNVTYEFIPYENETDTLDTYDSPGYYDSLVSQVFFKEFDAVVGDMSITANRSDFVDFTYEYMQAGVSMIVPARDDDTRSPWWFLEPLTKELWLTTLAFSVFKGFLIWIFEHKDNSDFQGGPLEVVGKVLNFSFTTFVFANSEKLNRNYSRVIMNVWTFLVFVLVTSYGANLTTMLTVERLQPTITNIDQLKRSGGSVGYQKGAFVFDVLKDMGFHESRLKAYGNVEEYEDALSTGEVAAIVDEIPYIKVFLQKHCRSYTRPQWTYRTGGFAFVFPRGSAMVSDISRAIIKLSEGKEMEKLANNLFEEQITCPDSNTPLDNKRLPLHSLRSIFIIAAVTSGLCFCTYMIQYIYETIIAGLIEKIMNSGRWLWIPALGRKLQRTLSCNHTLRVNPQSEMEVEFSTIEEATIDNLVSLVIQVPDKKEEGHQ